MNIRRIAVGALLAVGLWQIAAGLYLPAKARLAQWLIRAAWDDGRAAAAALTPWPWADMTAVGRLRAVAHDKDFIVLSGVSGEALAFGPGHMLASAAPGSGGHTILGGHRETHFRFLEHVTPGDRFELQGINGRRVVYEVQQVRAVNVHDEPLILEPDRSMLTLVTCYPFDAVVPGGPWRYVVDASATL
ncbi:MAG: class GN sortase [Pseudomonadota bacterium]